MRRIPSGTLALVLLWLVGCSAEKSVPVPEVSPPPLMESASFAALSRGARLYQEHCAQCHGPEAQGHPDWETVGVVAAPPLNGTGNDWKRTRAELIAVIKNGAQRGGNPVMPGWKGRLSDTEIEEVVAWFQALWPAEAHEKWQRANPAPRG
jgi:mono/diheme cytochrome c family protein